MQRIVNASSVVCFPGSVALTGTVSSSGTLVTGTGTSFVTELLYGGTGGMLKYKYLFSSVQKQVIEIISVLSPTTLVIKQAFASPLSAEALKVADPFIGMNSISADPLAAGATMANINETPATLDENATVGYYNSNGLTPVVIGAGTADCIVTLN